MNRFEIRPATERDVPLLLRLIRELAEYEHLSDQVTATADSLSRWMFEQKRAEALIGELDGVPVGFALYFYNFSTFLGQAGLYLEDLYLVPEARGNGYGTAFLKHLCTLCKQQGCGRLKWWCLDWNQPSIDFYRSLGAQPMQDWTVYRMTEEAMTALLDR